MSSPPNIPLQENGEHHSTELERSDKNSISENSQQTQSEMGQKYSLLTSTPTSPSTTANPQPGTGFLTEAKPQASSVSHNEDILIDISPPFDPSRSRPRNRPPILGQTEDLLLDDSPLVHSAAHTRPETQEQGRQTARSQEQEFDEQEIQEGFFLDLDESLSSQSFPERERRHYSISNYAASRMVHEKESQVPVCEAPGPPPPTEPSSSAAASSSSQSQSQSQVTSAATNQAPQAAEPEGCSICFEPFTSHSILLPCRHGFDFECIYPWLRNNYQNSYDLTKLTCPLCRKIVKRIRHREQPDDKYQTLNLEEHFCGRRSRPEESRREGLRFDQHGFLFHSYFPHDGSHVGYQYPQVAQPRPNDEWPSNRPNSSHRLVGLRLSFNLGDYVSDELFDSMDAVALARFLERQEDSQSGEDSATYNIHGPEEFGGAVRELLPQPELPRQSPPRGRLLAHTIHRRLLPRNGS